MGFRLRRRPKNQSSRTRNLPTQLGGLEATAHADRLDGQGQAGGIVGFHKHPAQGRFALGWGKSVFFDLAAEPIDGLIGHHADDRIVVAAHAKVGLIGRAFWQNLGVGGGNMAVGANHQ